MSSKHVAGKKTAKRKGKKVKKAKKKAATPEMAPTARDARMQLVADLEERRNSRVLAYICGDRSGAGAQIADDALRPMYDHVRRMGRVEKLDLFLYSRGGFVEVPWRIVTMLREYCKHLGVLIPYRANSAATLVALGCDEIVMGSKAELGPIDAALQVGQAPGTETKEQIRVEDVMSFIRFIREVAGLGDQAAIAENVRILADKISPWHLGAIYRTHTHIRALARKMLTSHTEKVEEQAATLITESLAEKTYSHGHAIGRDEAKGLGLPVEKPSAEIEELMWRLFESYEALLELRKPLDPRVELGPDKDEVAFRTIIALIESRFYTHAHRGNLRLKRTRKAPGQVNINLNLQMQLPSQIDAASLPQQVQDAIKQLVEQVQRSVPPLVRDQIRRQSPVHKIEGGLEGAAWCDITAEGI